MLLFDTEGIPAADRVDAYRAAVVVETGSCGIDHEPGPDGLIVKRIESWRFGPMTMYLNSGTGLRYRQTARHLRMDSWNTVSVITQPSGRGGFVWNDLSEELTAGNLVVTTKSAGYWEVNWSGQGASLALLTDADRVGLPESVVHAAVPRIAHSPVAPLLLAHMRGVHRGADLVADGPGAEDLGASTLALVRALIASAGAGTRHRRDVAEETRLVRVLAYVRRHLPDAGLTPARIAAAHNISLRSLYRLCEDGGVSLEQWIIRRRLEGACRDLAAPEHAHRTIDAVARAWGFASNAHFTRRFRQAYGVTPRAWRAER